MVFGAKLCQNKYQFDEAGFALCNDNDKHTKQAGAELGQAQLKLGPGFTSTIDS